MLACSRSSETLLCKNQNTQNMVTYITRRRWRSRQVIVARCLRRNIHDRTDTDIQRAREAGTEGDARVYYMRQNLSDSCFIIPRLITPLLWSWRSLIRVGSPWQAAWWVISPLGAGEYWLVGASQGATRAIGRPQTPWGTSHAGTYIYFRCSCSSASAVGVLRRSIGNSEANLYWRLPLDPANTAVHAGLLLRSLAFCSLAAARLVSRNWQKDADAPRDSLCRQPDVYICVQVFWLERRSDERFFASKQDSEKRFLLFFSVLKISSKPTICWTLFCRRWVTFAERVSPTVEGLACTTNDR